MISEECLFMFIPCNKIYITISLFGNLTVKILLIAPEIYIIKTLTKLGTLVLWISRPMIYSDLLLFFILYPPIKGEIHKMKI